MDAGEQPTLVVLTTGKESFVRANAVLQMTLMVRKTAETPVELLLLGPGVEILRSNQKNSPQFDQELTALREAGVQVAVCQVSLESLGLTKDQMFEAEAVKGGVEVATRLQAGWHVLTSGEMPMP
ncbi:MAG: DsrE family protein [Actinomycetota bacterium]|nr:DsrE family protein [Actinomycetota bacterium]